MPVSSAVICVEGVLQKNVSSAPIPAGIALYHSLSSNFNVLLISESAQEQVEHWLKLEALNKHSAIEYNDSGRPFMNEEGRKLHQINSLRLRRYNIEFVIDPNPQSAALLVRSGFTVLTFTHAQYAMPQWRPDYQEERKPWQAFVDEANAAAELRALDERLKKINEKDYL